MSVKTIELKNLPDSDLADLVGEIKTELHNRMDLSRTSGYKKNIEKLKKIYNQTQHKYEKTICLPIKIKVVLKKLEFDKNYIQYFDDEYLPEVYVSLSSSNTLGTNEKQFWKDCIDTITDYILETHQPNQFLIPEVNNLAKGFNKIVNKIRQIDGGGKNKK